MESPPAGLSAASAAELVISAVSAAVAVTTRQITQITTDYICTPSPTVVSFRGTTTALPPYVFTIARSGVRHRAEVVLDRLLGKSSKSRKAALLVHEETECLNRNPETYRCPRSTECANEHVDISDGLCWKSTLDFSYAS